MKYIALIFLQVFFNKGAKLLGFHQVNLQKNYPAWGRSSFTRMSAGVLVTVCNVALLTSGHTADSFQGESHNVNPGPVSDNSFNKLVSILLV